MEKKLLRALGPLCLFVLLASRFVSPLFFDDDVRLPQDFTVYMTAAERWIAGEAIYVPTDGLPFKYSPTFILAFRYLIFSWGPKGAAVLWQSLGIAVFCAGLALLLARLPQNKKTAAIVVGALGLSWHGVLEVLGYGQADLFIAGGALALLAREKRGDWVDAFIWAAILSIKPQMGIAFLPVAIAYGHLGTFRVAAASVVTLLFPVLFVGPTELFILFRDWIACVSQQQDAAFMLHNMNQSLPVVLARRAGEVDAVHEWIRAGLVLYLIAMTDLARLSRRKSLSHSLAFAIGLSGYLCFSPISWRWQILFWVPAVLALYSSAPRTPISRLLLAAWAVMALFTHGWLARILALDQEDWMSAVGIFAIASAFLWLASLFEGLARARTARS